VTILCWLDRISASDRPLVGEKAFIASELHQRGYPIIRGFAILNRIFAEFLETINNTDSFLTDFPQSSLYLDVDNPKALPRHFTSANSSSLVRRTNGGRGTIIHG
jgi:pyruvate,water dikinase